MICAACSKSLAITAKKYCSVQCQKHNEYNSYISDWKNGLVSGMRGKNTYNFSAYIVRYMFEKYNHKCYRCGWGEVNTYTGKVPLEIEHIDGDAQNNREDNLVLLCPNCHSLTKTHKNANFGRGRAWRRKTNVL